VGDFHNPDSDLDRFRFRLGFAAIVVLLAFGLLIGRFVWLQVIQHDFYQTRAEDNRIALIPIVPNRGVITDRNGIVLARNYSAFTLEITPSRVPNLEASIDALATVIDIQPKDRKRFKRVMDEAKNFRVDSDPYPSDRCRSRPICRPALSLSGNRSQGPTISPVSAR
jgi:penicillin-binding protein 2